MTLHFAGKEARKRELKKNKKQRMMVRQAVLKGKDPYKLLEDMELIDKMGQYCYVVDKIFGFSFAESQLMIILALNLRFST